MGADTFLQSLVLSFHLSLQNFSICSLYYIFVIAKMLFDTLPSEKSAFWAQGARTCVWTPPGMQAAFAAILRECGRVPTCVRPLVAISKSRAFMCCDLHLSATRIANIAIFRSN